MEWEKEYGDERYEVPLPQIRSDIGKIRVSVGATGTYSGAFHIQNTGGSTLRGRVWSKTEHVVFQPMEWEGNMQVMRYRINGEGLQVGSRIESTAIISSNGGEISIPIEITVTPPALYIDDEKALHSLKDFAAYANSDFQQAKEVFLSPSFLQWLRQNGEEKWMPIYEHLLVDANKERVLENFLVLTGWKQRPKLTLEDGVIQTPVLPNEKKVLKKSVKIKKAGAGFTEGKVSANAPWIKVSVEEFQTRDFVEDDLLIPFEIVTKALPGRHNIGALEITSDDQTLGAEIVVTRLPWLEIKLSRPSFRLEDKGHVIVENHTGEDLMLEIQPEEKWIQFQAKKYFISRHAEIPFEVLLNTWNRWMSQPSFKKQPFYQTKIQIKTQYKKEVIRKTINVQIGSLLG